jgi:mono/diheme cytochrome c family protein
MGAALPDDDLAAVLTYIRQSWGNQASAVTPEQVKAVRTEVGNRSQPWTAEQLNAIQ